MATKSAGLGQLEDVLELYLVKKAPFQLPSGVKEVIVKFAPWVTIVMMLIALPAVLAIIGLSTFAGALTGLLGPFATAQYAQGITVSVIVLLITVVLQLMALPGLFARSVKGWRLVFYATLVSLIASLLNPLSIISALISAVIGLYFLFQIKNLYK